MLIITNFRDKHNQANIYCSRYKPIFTTTELVRSNSFYYQLLSHVLLLKEMCILALNDCTIGKDLCGKLGLSQLIVFIPSNEAITNTLLQLEVIKAHPSFSHPSSCRMNHSLVHITQCIQRSVKDMIHSCN